MNWKEYEKEIFEFLKETYKDATITIDQTLKGRYSQVDRQIDVLIESYIAGKKIRLIVDGKYFNKNIDVKEVESFISMVEDVDAKQGILITSKGFSKAAINRAYYGPTDIELDILNFSELKEFQAHEGIIYSGNHGAIVPAPFGWIIDGTKRKFAVATFYQRGLTFVEAAKKKEWIYVNIFNKDDQIKSMDDLIQLQESYAKDYYPKAVFEYNSTIRRADNAKTFLRTIIIDKYPTNEYTGFIEFDEYFVFFVLFTPIELKEKNLRKLENLIERTLPIKVRKNEKSILESKLKNLKNSSNKATDLVEKAELLVGQGDILKRLKNYDEANQKYDESIKILSTCYGAIKGKIQIAVLKKLSIEELIPLTESLYELGPTNPTVCSDLMDLLYDAERVDDLMFLLKHGAEKYKENLEAFGNFNYNIGLLSVELGNYKDAEQSFLIARKSFKKSLVKDNYVFSLIEQNLRLLKK